MMSSIELFCRFVRVVVRLIISLRALLVMDGILLIALSCFLVSTSGAQDSWVLSLCIGVEWTDRKTWILRALFSSVYPCDFFFQYRFLSRVNTLHNTMQQELTILQPRFLTPAHSQQPHHSLHHNIPQPNPITLFFHSTFRSLWTAKRNG